MMEDRIHAAGNGAALNKAIETFEASRRNPEDENILYDALVNLGAEPEEADAFIELTLAA